MAAVEPFGEYREELRHGQMMSLHANINRDGDKKKKPYIPLDFMNFVEREPEPESTPEECYARIDREVFGL